MVDVYGVIHQGLLLGMLIIPLLLLLYLGFWLLKRQQQTVNITKTAAAVQRQQLIVAERKRIGRDLHDGTLQSLYAVGLRLEHSLGQDEIPEAVRQAVQESLQDLCQIMAQMRSYVDRLTESGPSELQLHLKALVAELGGLYKVPITFAVSEWTEPGFDAQAILEISMILREAVSNAVRHGKPQNISVELTRTPQSVQLSVIDDGSGFSPEKVAQHRGLKYMRERAELLGGRFQVQSEIGAGTTVDLQIPVH